MIILISGKQGSGKTTTTKLLEKKIDAMVVRYRFAQPIYEAHDRCLDVLEHYGVVRNMVKDGPLLQLLGTEWGRGTIDPDIWVKCALNWYEQNVQGKLDMFGPAVGLIDDLRFKNEMQAFRDKDAMFVRLECSRDIRKSRAENWRTNEQHVSEVDLDDWTDRFDLVLDSGIMTPALIADTIVRKWNERASGSVGVASRAGLHGRADQASMASAL